jgi:hypothetical protein
MSIRPLIPFVKWPGLTAGVRSLTYSCSQGTTAGTVVMATNPQNSAPILDGVLMFGAGSNGIELTDVRVVDVITERSGGGFVWIWQMEDRRWRWRHGFVSGCYNELDHTGKLVPWTIRSPTELALLCLREMGETRFSIDLPIGLNTRDGKNYARRLKAGENFPDLGANPPTRWDVTNAAAALSALCGRYGRRIFFDPVGDQVIIAPAGGTLPIPFGSINTDGVSLATRPIPRAVVAAGDYIRYQMLLPVEAVAKEWDGTYVPIDEVSYAPTGEDDAVAQVINVLAINTGTDPIDCTVDGKTISGLGRTDLRNKLLADAYVTGLYTITGTGSVVDPLVFTRNEAGTNGDVIIVLPNGPSTPPPVEYVRSEVKVVGVKKSGWAAAVPPDFYQAVATDRLTKDQAIQLARESVYRCYRVKNNDVSGQGPIYVPGYGPVNSRWQLVLTGNKVEQIKPEELNTEGFNLAAFWERGIPGPYYNGQSQDQPAMVYGSYFNSIGSVLWNGPGENTTADKRVFIPFTVEPYEQLVIFEQPVYRVGGGNTGGAFLACDLVLECAVKVRDAQTNQLIRGTFFLDLGGTAPQYAEVFPDLIVEYVGEYTQQTAGDAYTEDDLGNKVAKNGAAFLATYQIDKVRQFAPESALARSRIYLDAMARQFLPFPAESVKLNGIYKVPMSSSIQQLTWELGAGGFYTTLSANTEHNYAIPSFLARRLPENLPAIDQINKKRAAETAPDTTSGGRAQR